MFARFPRWFISDAQVCMFDNFWPDGVNVRETIQVNSLFQQADEQSVKSKFLGLYVSEHKHDLVFKA